MSHHRHRHWCRPRRACTCALCAELDLNHPGEGRQMALPLAEPSGRGAQLPPAPMIVMAAQVEAWLAGGSEGQ